MNKKLQIFVSSTYSDLIEERQEIVIEILKFGSIPAGMELFTANSEEQFKIIKRWIDTSDIYLLVLGGRYGSICDKTKLSYTEMEYDYAIKKQKPIIAIVLDDKYLLNKESQIISTYELNNLKYLDFKKKVTSKMVRFVSSIEELKTNVLSSINEIQNDEKYHLTGWVRGDLTHIVEKYKIGEMSFNEMNEYLSSHKFTSDNETVNKMLKKVGNTALDIYYFLIFYGGEVHSNSSNDALNFLFYEVIPKYTSVGLMEIKKASGRMYFTSIYTRNGIKYNQLLLKLKNEKLNIK